MKILFCTNSLGAKGGIEKSLIIRANAFAEVKDIEVAICYTDKGTYPEDLIYPLSDKVKVIDLGVPFWDLHPLSLKNILVEAPKKFIRLRRSIKSTIRIFAPDIVITTGSYEKFALASLKPTKLIGKPCAKIREYRFNSTYRNYLPEKPWAIRIAEIFEFRFLCNMFDMNYLLTKEDKQSNFKNRRNFDYMYNPVHISESPRIPMSKRDKAVIVACRLEDQKNVHAIIRAWASIIKDTPGWILRIAGDGSQREELEMLARSLGVNDSVQFLGFRRDIPNLMRCSRIMAMTSRYEGFMNSMIEALSEGTISISYRTPYGPSDLITNGVDGVLVNYMDESKFASNLKEIMLSAEKQEEMSKAAVVRANDFKIDKIIAQWITKYNELLKAKECSR